MPVSDEDRIAAARSYIEALASHRADDVPFAPGCQRIEFGVKTGFSGEHLRRSLNGGPQYRVIESVDISALTVSGDEVRARFELTTRPRLAGRRVAARVDEVFLIPASGETAQIHHIRAKVRPFLTR